MTKVSPIRSVQAFALPVVLIIVVVCTILAVGLFLSITRERAAAMSMGDNEQAKLVAQTAIDHAMALLENIPQPRPPGASLANPRNWITSPGLLTLTQGVSDVTKIPLSTNPSASYVPGAEDANLNLPLTEPDSAGRKVHPIVGSTGGASAPDVKVAWVNVLRDPSQTASRDNPIVARYAFWIDDESTKLNPSLASGKPNLVSALPGATDATLPLDKPNPLMKDSLETFSGTVGVSENYAIPIRIRNSPAMDFYYPLWHPYALNLEVFDQSGAALNINELTAWVHNPRQVGTAVSSPSSYVGQWRPLENIEDIQRFVTGDRAGYFEKNKFDLTSRGLSPEFNVFGKSRVHFERTIPNGDNGIFFQFDYDEDGPIYTHGSETFAGTGTNTWTPNANGLPMVANAIARLLARSDWPGMPARSFVDKWGGVGVGQREADQVAWNMTVLASYSANREKMVGIGSSMAEGNEPVSRWFQNTTNYGGVSLNNKEPNRRLFKGELSGKAILPWYPVPLVNEIAFCVEPIEVLNGTLPKSPREFVLKAWFELEYHFGGPDATMVASQRMPVVAVKDKFGYGFKITHIEYTATGAQGEMAAQTKIFDGGPGAVTTPDSQVTAFNGKIVPAGAAGEDLVIMRSGEYDKICKASRQVILTSGTSVQLVSTSTTPANYAPAAYPKFKSEVNLQTKFRIAHKINQDATVYQVLPVWDSTDGAAFLPPAGESDRLEISMTFDPAEVHDFFPGGVIKRSLEVADARLGNNTSAWEQRSAGPGEADGTTLGAENDLEAAVTGDKSKYAYFDFQTNAYNSVFPRGSIGMLSVIPTGMQRGLPNQTLKFQPSANKAELPDWLMLDLFAPALRPLSHMNSVVGKVNPNASLTPAFATNLRWRPLQAVFQNMRGNTTVSPGASSPSTVVSNILGNQRSGQDFGAPGVYDYIGELCEVQGVADTGADDWQKEALIRNLANLLTTKSGSFTIWGVAQVIRKKGGNTDYGVYQAGDRIVGEKRFRVEVDRLVWPGVDGVPGNGTVNASGVYDKVAKPTGVNDYTNTRKIGDVPWGGLPAPNYSSNQNAFAGATWPVIDGPDAPTFTPQSQGQTWGQVDYSNTPLLEAANPLRAWMRLKLRGIDYLDQ